MTQFSTTERKNLGNEPFFVSLENQASNKIAILLKENICILK